MPFVRWLKNLDRILQGQATQLPALREGTVDVPPGGISLVIALLGAVYGACMGCFALFSEHGPGVMQALASMLKVPALFFLTLLVTFPSLYVFNALVGSRLRMSALLRLLVASLAVNLTVLASLGPIVAFFSLSTTSYPFMVLLNVVVFAISGMLGLKFLLQTLHRLSIVAHLPPEESSPGPGAAAPSPPSAESAAPAPPREGEPAVAAPSLAPPVVMAQVVEGPSPLDPIEGHVLGRHVKTVFQCWVVVFGLVGAQMSWVLRPFIGEPNSPFAWFRPRESNFFESVVRAFLSLFS